MPQPDRQPPAHNTAPHGAASTLAHLATQGAAGGDELAATPSLRCSLRTHALDTPHDWLSSAGAYRTHRDRDRDRDTRRHRHRHRRTHTHTHTRTHTYTHTRTHAHCILCTHSRQAAANQHAHRGYGSAGLGCSPSPTVDHQLSLMHMEVAGTGGGGRSTRHSESRCGPSNRNPHAAHTSCTAPYPVHGPHTPCTTPSTFARETTTRRPTRRRPGVTREPKRTSRR